MQSPTEGHQQLCGGLQQHRRRRNGRGIPSPPGRVDRDHRRLCVGAAHGHCPPRGEADKFTREGKFKGWRPQLLLGSDVGGKTIGIVGMGRIGQAMAGVHGDLT